MSEEAPPPRAIDLMRYADQLAGAREYLRVWAMPEGGDMCFVNPMPLGPDPIAFGLAMVDCVRHAAKAYARAVNIDESEALARIWEGLDTERDRPTDDPVSFTAR